jgi:hypothetical protein
MNEAAGSQNQSQQQGAPVSNSNSQWQTGNQTLQTPRATHSGQPNQNIAPRNSTGNSPVTVYSAPSSQTTHLVPSTPMITEGPNSGGNWTPGLTEPTYVPNASASTGWIMGYNNQDYTAPRIIVRESAGTSSSSSHQDWNQKQQQQIDRQQQEINRQQQEINHLQQRMNQQQQNSNQQNQSAPSSNSNNSTDSSNSSQQ